MVRWRKRHPPPTFPWMLDSDVVLTHCVGGKLNSVCSYNIFYYILLLLYISLSCSSSTFIFFPSFLPAAEELGPACYHTCVTSFKGLPYIGACIFRERDTCCLFKFPTLRSHYNFPSLVWHLKLQKKK